MTMKSKRLTRIMSLVSLVPFVSFAVLTTSLGTMALASAASKRNGILHVTKDCPPTQYTGAPGSFCTITSSNLLEIRVGSKVFYDQAAGIPAGLLDSNVVLDAGNGDRAVGRCTLDFSTGLGLCTFSDGTGDLAGFHARIDVDCRSGCRWDGPYSFTPRDDDR
jgi:hypothetical protein